ncbi:MAG: hypothetical protein AAF802_25915 [Planctomycetota bacterium]
MISSSKVIERRRSCRQRNAVVLVTVLVCVVVSSAVIAGIVTSALHERRQCRQELQMEQTRWCLEAGLVYAVEKCREDESYVGEVITLSPPLDDRKRTEIRVLVENTTDEEKLVTVLVMIEGDGPADLPTRRSRSVTVKALENDES